MNIQRLVGFLTLGYVASLAAAVDPTDEVEATPGDEVSWDTPAPRRRSFAVFNIDDVRTVYAPSFSHTVFPFCSYSANSNASLIFLHRRTFVETANSILARVTCRGFPSATVNSSFVTTDDPVGTCFGPTTVSRIFTLITPTCTAIRPTGEVALRAHLDDTAVVKNVVFSTTPIIPVRTGFNSGHGGIMAPEIWYPSRS